MSDMQSFVSWFLTSLPDFLMSEPVCYFVGFFFLSVVVVIFRRITGLSYNKS